MWKLKEDKLIDHMILAFFVKDHDNTGPSKTTSTVKVGSMDRIGLADPDNGL